jgi:hypothetical protein
MRVSPKQEIHQDLASAIGLVASTALTYSETDGYAAVGTSVMQTHGIEKAGALLLNIITFG